MCGRYYIADEDTAEDLKRIIAEVNRRHNGDASIKTSGEIRPTDTIPVLANTPKLQPGAYAMRWGYTMPDGTPMFNARSETASSKVMFKDGIAQRRCIIPASYYFEWEKRGKERVKYAIGTQGGSMIYMAGMLAASVKLGGYADAETVAALAEAEAECHEIPAPEELAYNVTGERRKALVVAVANYTGEQAIYQNAPTFAYHIGQYAVDKNGLLTGPIDHALIRWLDDEGFTTEE